MEELDDGEDEVDLLEESVVTDVNTVCQSFLDEAYNNNDYYYYDNNNQRNNSFTSRSSAGSGSRRSSSDALDLQVYLTAKKNAVNPTLEQLPFIHRGRPNIKELFRKTRDEAIMKKEKRVAVCVCAPKRLVHMCHKACVKFRSACTI